MTPPAVARLHPDDLEALADLVVRKLLSARESAAPLVSPRAPVGGRDDCGEAGPVLLTARQVASRYGVSAEWVRDHQGELGVVRLGDGPRPRLRFDPVKVAEA